MKFETTDELNVFLKGVKNFADLSNKEYTYIETFDMFLFETSEGLRVWTPLVEETDMSIQSEESARIPNEDDLYCLDSEIKGKEEYLHKIKSLRADNISGMNVEE